MRHGNMEWDREKAASGSAAHYVAVKPVIYVLNLIFEQVILSSVIKIYHGFLSNEVSCKGIEGS
jgi:hypothetical protein